MYCRAHMTKAMVLAAFVTDRPASGSEAKSDAAAEAWDLMNESALAAIQNSVMQVSRYSMTAVSTAKEARDALKHVFEARDSARLLQRMSELSNLKMSGDKDIINCTSRAEGIRQEHSMLES